MSIQLTKLLPSAPQIVLTGVLKGVYAAGTDYAPGDVVTYAGGTYIMHTDAAAGTLPTNAAAWQAINSPQAYVESIDALVLTNTAAENCISIVQNGNVGTNLATDGALHINNTNNTGLGLVVYSDQDGTASAPLVNFKADNVAFDQTVCRIETDGNSSGLVVVGTKTDGTSQALVNISDANTVGGNQTLKIVSARGGGVEAVLIDMNGNGRALFIDHDDTSFRPSLEIDRDSTLNGGFPVGLAITVDNAGTGNGVVGIDFSGMSAGERLLKLPTDDTPISTTTTNSTGRIAVSDAANNIRYIPYFT